MYSTASAGNAVRLLPYVHAFCDLQIGLALEKMVMGTNLITPEWAAVSQMHKKRCRAHRSAAACATCAEILREFALANGPKFCTLGSRIFRPRDKEQIAIRIRGE